MTSDDVKKVREWIEKNKQTYEHDYYDVKFDYITTDDLLKFLDTLDREESSNDKEQERSGG